MMIGRFNFAASAASAATIVAASGPFMSQTPRPTSRSPSMRGDQASVVQLVPGTVSRCERKAIPPVPSPLRPTMFTFSTPLASVYSSRSVTKPRARSSSSIRSAAATLLFRLTDSILDNSLVNSITSSAIAHPPVRISPNAVAHPAAGTILLLSRAV